MSIRRDLLLRTALLRLPDLAALRAAPAPAAAALGGAAGQPARPSSPARRRPLRKAAFAKA